MCGTVCCLFMLLAIGTLCFAIVQQTKRVQELLAEINELRAGRAGDEAAAADSAYRFVVAHNGTNLTGTIYGCRMELAAEYTGRFAVTLDIIENAFRAYGAWFAIGLFEKAGGQAMPTRVTVSTEPIGAVTDEERETLARRGIGTVRPGNRREL